MYFKLTGEYTRVYIPFDEESVFLENASDLSSFALPATAEAKSVS